MRIFALLSNSFSIGTLCLFLFFLFLDLLQLLPLVHPTVRFEREEVRLQVAADRVLLERYLDASVDLLFGTGDCKTPSL